MGSESVGEFISSGTMHIFLTQVQVLVEGLSMQTAAVTVHEFIEAPEAAHQSTAAESTGVEEEVLRLRGGECVSCGLCIGIFLFCFQFVSQSWLRKNQRDLTSWVRLLTNLDVIKHMDTELCPETDSVTEFVYPERCNRYVRNKAC
jgi:hypothetical protein